MRTLNALFILVLVGVLCSGYFVQFDFHEQPCPLCMLQRLSMIGVASGLLLNLRFGIRPAHYGISLLSALLGAAVAVRQISYHICPNFPAFEKPIFGLNLYTWGFIVFACSIFAIAVLQILNRYSEEKPLSRFEKLAYLALFLVALANAITTYLECGLTPCAA